MILKRFFDDNAFDKLKEGFGFLIEIVNASAGDFATTLGNNHIVLFYQGQLFSRIEVSIFGEFEVMLPKTCFPDEIRDNKKFNFRGAANGYFAEMNAELLEKCFNQNSLELFKQQLSAKEPKAADALVQSVICANRQREDFMIIDRFVTDGELKGKRMNMLALELVNDSYELRILEPCTDAKQCGEVANSLEFFVKNMKHYMSDYKTNFENNYKQRFALGLHQEPLPSTIEIRPQVKGILLLSSGIELPAATVKNYPNLDIRVLPEDLKL